MKLKEFNIIYGGLLVAMLIAEMTLAAVFPLYVIRFLQFFILINIIGGGFKILNKAGYFVFPASIYILNSIFFFKDATVSGDLYNLLWWVVFMFILNHSISEYKDFSKFKDILFKGTFALTTLAGAFGLYKFLLISQGIILPFMEIEMLDGSISPLLGSSLNIDYNIYSIGLFCGLFSGMYCYRRTIIIKLKLLFSFGMLILLMSAMLSSSRRGLIIGVVLIIFLLFWSFRSASWSEIKAFSKRRRFKLVKVPWLIIVFGSMLFFLGLRINVNSVIESSSEVTSLIGRLETINSITSKENDTRGNRWNYAFEYYLDLPLFSQLFGDGFTYMKFFGREFGEGEVDHPHNVWISSLLYGGFLGFILTTWLTIYVLYLFYSRRKVFSEITYWYILFLFLNFTSSNSIYSSRVFVVLLLLPFLNFAYRRYETLNQKLALG